MIYLFIFIFLCEMADRLNVFLVLMLLFDHGKTFMLQSLFSR